MSNDEPVTPVDGRLPECPAPEPAGSPPAAEAREPRSNLFTFLGMMAVTVIVIVLLMQCIESPNHGARQSAQIEREARRAQIEQSIRRSEPAGPPAAQSVLPPKSP